MGFSLVELVVSMTGGAAVFCLAIATIEHTMKLSNECSGRAEHQQTVARLGQQFRSDVHQVNEFRLEASNGVKLSTLVTYRQPSLTARQPAGASPDSPQLPAGQESKEFVLTTHPLANENAAANHAPSRTTDSALRLTADSGEIITYTVVGSTVTREGTKPGSDIVTRETYRLHKQCSAQLESKDAQHISLLIVRHPPDGGELLENRIVAHAGRLFSLQTLRKGP